MLLLSSRKRYFKVALVSLVLSLSCPLSYGAASVRQGQSRGEQDDDDTFTIQLPPHVQFQLETSTTAKSKFQVQMPSGVARLFEKFESLTVGPSVDNNVDIPQVFPLLHGGFALLAVGTFVWTEHGFKEFKELAMGSVSALALVWLPTLLLQGSVFEIVSLATLFTQPTIRQVLFKELVPRAMKTIKQLVMKEVWALIWPLILAPLPKPFLSPTDEDIMRIRWLPHWFKEGFLVFRNKIDRSVLEKMKGSVKKTVEKSAGLGELFTVTEDDASESGGGPQSNDQAEADDGPQIVCDGDVCWME